MSLWESADHMPEALILLVANLSKFVRSVIHLVAY